MELNSGEKTMKCNRFYAIALCLTGACMWSVMHAMLSATENPAIAQSAAAQPGSRALAAEVDAMKGKLPDQAHAMQDVGYHFSNLWFAAQESNWPLAAFYNQETLSHLNWAVRIIPRRKDSAEREIDLKAILQAFENSPWTQIKNAIAAQDKPSFEKAYRFAIETCYACHVASDKPFLRLQVPTRPETPIINFDPNASWPR